MLGDRTSDDTGLLAVADDCLKARQGSEVTPIGSYPSFRLIQCPDVRLHAPVIYNIVSPAIGLILVALGAGIGAAGADRHIGAGNPHTVIASRIDAHVELIGHVAVNTGGTRTGGRVPVVTGLVVSLWLMALGAYAITLGDQGIAVWFVAITANHSRSRHLALHKGAININLISNLPVVPVKRRLHRGYSVCIAQGLPKMVITQRGSPRMTAAAALDLH